MSEDYRVPWAMSEDYRIYVDGEQSATLNDEAAH